MIIALCKIFQNNNEPFLNVVTKYFGIEEIIVSTTTIIFLLLSTTPMVSKLYWLHYRSGLSKKSNLHTPDHKQPKCDQCSYLKTYSQDCGRSKCSMWNDEKHVYTEWKYLV